MSSDYLRLQTLALMGQEFLEQALRSGGSIDAAATGMLLHPKQLTGEEKPAATLADSIRAEAALMRQGSQNASKVAIMAATVRDACLSLGALLNEVQTLLQAVAGGQAEPVTVQSPFEQLAARVIAAIAAAEYNDISLMDKDRWLEEERLTVVADTVTLHIELGESATNFVLYDFSPLKNLAGINLGAEYAANGLRGLLTAIPENIETIMSMATSHQALAASFASEAKRLESQADILAQRAARARIVAGSSS